MRLSWGGVGARRKPQSAIAARMGWLLWAGVCRRLTGEFRPCLDNGVSGTGPSKTRMGASAPRRRVCRGQAGARNSPRLRRNAVMLLEVLSTWSWSAVPSVRQLQWMEGRFRWMPRMQGAGHRLSRLGTVRCLFRGSGVRMEGACLMFSFLLVR